MSRKPQGVCKVNPSDVIDALATGLNDVPDHVFAFTPDGCYLFVNQAAAAWLGLAPEDVIGYHWRDLGFDPDVLEPLTEKLAEVAESGVAVWHDMHGSERRGRPMMNISLTPLRSESGGVMGVLVIKRDVTRYVNGEWNPSPA